MHTIVNDTLMRSTPPQSGVVSPPVQIRRVEHMLAVNTRLGFRPTGRLGELQKKVG